MEPVKPVNDIKEVRSQNDALIALGMALRGPVKVPDNTSRYLMLVPNADGGVDLKELERLERPERRTGKVTVVDIDSFIALVKRFDNLAETVVYGSLEPLGFTAVVNDHTGNAAGWRDHTVTLALKHSPEWTLWTASDGKWNPQEAFAYFIQENLPDFKRPTGAKMLELATNFRMRKGMSFQSAMMLQNGDIDLQYVERTQEAQANKSLKAPEKFEIEVPVWAGLEQRSYVCEAFFRYRVAEGSLHLKYDLERPQKVTERAFEEVLDKIRGELTNVPVVFGTHDK
jgi:uncharacterized protein YfdQ (DUF2303 family)